MRKILCFLGIHKLYNSGLSQETLVDDPDLFIYPKKLLRGFYTNGKCKYCDKQILIQDDLIKKF